MAVKVKARSRKSQGQRARTLSKTQPSIVETRSSIPSSPAEKVTGRPFRLDLALCTVLLLATLAVYFRATRNPFVNFDDPTYVTENRNIQQGLTSATLKWALLATYATNWHPLTWISHALDYQLFGLNAAGHHLTSVLLHALNAGILFLLLARVTGARTKSLIVAAIFALHPINVESVAWVAERKNVLAMFFLLLTMATYAWYARRPRPQRYLATSLLFILALAAKPMVVTLPFLLLLWDFWPLARVRGLSQPSEAFPVPQFSLSRLALEKLPLLLLSAASSVLTIIAQRSVISSNEHLPLGPRIANAIYAYAAYLGKALWPTRLAAFYPYEGLRTAAWTIFLCAVLLLAITVFVWRERSHPYLPVGWLWFLGSLVPMIGLIQVGDQALADRYAYLPLLGIFMMIVWGVGDLVQNRSWNPKVALRVAAVILAALSFLTWRQIGSWDSSYDLWANALANTRDNYMAENYVGTAMLFDDFKATGQRFSERAYVHFQNAVRIKPTDPISHLNLGAYQHEHGRIREAIQEYGLTLRLTADPYLVEKCLVDLGAAYHQLREYDTGRKYYLQALKMNPQNMVAFENLGKLGVDENIARQAQAAAASPSASAYFQLGQSQQAAQHIPEARESFLKALALNPKFQEAQQALNALDQQ